MEGHPRSVGAVFREFGKVISVPPNSTDAGCRADDGDGSVGSGHDEWMQAAAGAAGGEREVEK